MSPEREFNQLLRDSGAVLIRSRHHNVYRLPSGQRFVTSRTPSDCRSAHRRIRDLKRLLSQSPAPPTPQR